MVFFVVAVMAEMDTRLILLLVFLWVSVVNNDRILIRIYSYVDVGEKRRVKI